MSRSSRAHNRAAAAADSCIQLACAVEPARRADWTEVARHLDALTKPPGSLGRLEDLAARLALIYGDPPPPLIPRTVFLLAADHGVAHRGVSAYPAAVTGQMCRNYAHGGAAINVIARAVHADVVVADVGVDADLDELPGIVHCKIRRGTRDLSEGPALTPEEVETAIQAGARLVTARTPETQVIALGEMGIGNTTSASAIAAAVTGAPVSAVVGPGTGVGGTRLARKREIVAQAVGRVPRGAGPVEILAHVGGLEIAGLVGAVLAAAAAERAVVLDGFITTAAATLAVQLAPAAGDYLIASHHSTEPGHGVVLDALGLQPLLALDLRLGEGTGAALALPLLDAAGGLLREMATFEAANVSTKLAEGDTP